MIDEKRRNTKLRAMLSSLIFSIALMIFPVVSGVVVVINGIDNFGSRNYHGYAYHN